MDEPWVEGFVKLRDQIRLVDQFTGQIAQCPEECACTEQSGS